MAFEGIKKRVNRVALRLQDWRNTDLNAFILVKTLLFYMGLWPRKNDLQGFGAFYRKWLPRCIFVMINYAMAAGFPVFTYQCLVAGDVQLLLESFATIFAAALMYGHLYCLLFQKDKLREVFVEMDVISEIGKRLPYQPDAILLLNKRWMEFVVFGLVLCLLINLSVSVVLYPNLYLARNFGFNEWFPFDALTSPVYEIVFVVNCLRLSYLIIMMVLLYIITWGMLVETVGQYRILLYNIENVRGRSRKGRGGARFAVIGTDIVKLRGEVDDDLLPMHGYVRRKPRKKSKRRLSDHEALKLCIQHHLSLIRFVHVVESTFEPILFIHVVCTMVPTGLAIALVMNAAEIDTKLVMIIFLVLGCYLLLALICIFGDKITDQDEAIRDAIYGCDWVGASKSFTRSMRIVMSYCNQPLVIKLAGFIPLNRENFYATMKLTYSYTMTIITQFK